MVVPPIPTPKWSFLVGKPIVVGYQHFRKPPYKGRWNFREVISGEIRNGYKWMYDVLVAMQWFVVVFHLKKGFGDDDIIIWKQSYPKQHPKLKFDKVQFLLFVSGLRIIWVFDSNRMFVYKVSFIIHTGVQECFKGVLGHIQYMLNVLIDGQNCLDWSKHWCVLFSLQRWKIHMMFCASGMTSYPGI